MASSAADGAASDGPVLSLMSKRLRALRKKHNRITQMEEAVSKGKTLNSEQEEVLRSKPAVLALIDEYEKLRQPLSAALHDELTRIPSRTTPTPTSPPPPPSPDGIEDLVGLLYFSSLFDVKPHSEFTATMLTRTHERGCCLTYDYVTDDAAEFLGEGDLDAISALGALVTSRPASAGVSHKNALRGCVEHARLWLERSDVPISPGASITYAGLREKVNKIMGSDYVTATPEMKVPDYVAATVEKYSTANQVQIPESPTVDDAPEQYQYKEEDANENFKEAVASPEQSSLTEESPKDEADAMNPSEEIVSGQQDLQKSEADVDEQNQQDAVQKEQHIPRRSYQNHRGGSRGGGNVGGRRGGYPNGRGGRRGGGGGYLNGRSQYYDPGYYPRNYYNNRGRGGRSGGPTMYNNHGGAAQGGNRPVNVE